MFEPASPTMPGAFSPAEPYGASRHRSVYHPPTPSTGPQTPAGFGASSSYFSQQATSPTMSSRQNENQRPLLVNRKRSRQDTISAGSHLPPLAPLPQDFDTIMRSRNTSSTFGGDTLMRSRNVSNTFAPDIPPSPMPFVNTQYALKGGLDTPTAQQARFFDDNPTESEFSDVNYRRTLATGRRTASGRHIGGEGLERDYHSFSRLPSSASLESNGRPRIASPEAPSSPGWSRWGINVVGGVVGTVASKVWQFCKAGAFVGFSAGGGEGYQVDAKHTKEQEIADDYSSTQIEFPDPPPAYSEEGYGGIPLSQYQEPGEESVCMVDYPPPETTAAQRPAKRRQISHENTQNSNDAAIERSWVVVPVPSLPSSPAPAPIATRRAAAPARYTLPTASSSSSRRPQTTYASPGSRASASARPPPPRRPLLHTRGSISISTSGSPGFNARNPPARPSTAAATYTYASHTTDRPTTASYASPRSSFGASPANGGYHSRIPIAAPRSGTSTPTGTPSRSHIPLPSARSGRQSVASNRGTPGTPGGGVLSPAALEAQKWREQKRREEMEEDVAMKRLNRQLRDMIREGQVALGTRFEVRDGEGDEEMDMDGC